MMDGVHWYISLNEWEPPLTAVEVDGRRYSADEVVAALRGAQDTRVFVWNGPRRVEDSWWYDLEWTEGVSEVTGEPIMLRYARVSWRHGSEASHRVSITYEREQGLGLYQWPQFKELAKAQDFASLLMRLEPEEAKLIHGTHWNGVVL
jgi:hypothetical protein